MEHTYRIYDELGREIRTMTGTEEQIAHYCNQFGYTYEIIEDTTASLDANQTTLIREFKWVEAAIERFIQNHDWANTKKNFELAIHQYETMMEYYLALDDRIEAENLRDRLDEVGDNSGSEYGDLFG